MYKAVLTLVLPLSCSFVMAQQAATPTTPTAALPSSPASITTPAEKPRVFVTDSQSWEMSGAAGGSNDTFAAESHGGARPQTAEIIKTFGQRCPEVIVNNKQELADFIVVLDHEGGKGYIRHRNKVAVFEHASGDLVISHSTLSLGGSVEDACNGILKHWASHGQEILAAKGRHPAPATPPSAPSPVPQPTSSSAVSLVVDSTPPGADIEVDGDFVCSTPSTVNVSIGKHQVAIKKKGFADWSKTLNVTGGSVHLNADLDRQQQAQ